MAMKTELNSNFVEVRQQSLQFAYARGYSADRLATKTQVEEWQTAGRAGKQKYLDVEKKMTRACRIAQYMGLDRLPPSRILDLGAGGAHFCVVAKLLGHEAIALDIPDTLYAALCELFDVQRVEHWIRPKDPVPESLGHFDVVTGLAIKFHERKKVYWSIENWTIFLSFITEKVMNTGGTQFYSFNYREDHPLNTADQEEIYRRDMYRDLHQFFIDYRFISPQPGVYMNKESILSRHIENEKMSVD